MNRFEKLAAKRLLTQKLLEKEAGMASAAKWIRQLLKKGRKPSARMVKRYRTAKPQKLAPLPLRRAPGARAQVGEALQRSGVRPMAR